MINISRNGHSTMRMKKLASLSIPIMAGMISQNILNYVDMIMVGRLGSKAIAAVGLGGLATFLSVAFVMGLSASVQTMTARRKGEGCENTMAIPLNGGLLLSFVIGIPLSILGYMLAPFIFSILNHDHNVIILGIPYLRARILSITMIGINFSFRGYWNGTNKSSYYMATLVFTNILNVILNYILIFGHFGAPKLGSTGAGIASTIALTGGCLVYFIVASYYAKDNGFLRNLPTLNDIKTLLKLAIPNGTQQTLYAGGITTLFWIIGLVGTPELAAANLITIMLLLGVLPGIGLGLAATSLVSQSLGQKNPRDAKRWGWEIATTASLLLFLIGIPMILFPTTLLSQFTNDPAVLAVGRVPLQITGIGLGIEAFSLVLVNALLGAGDSTRVMIISAAIQWGILLPLAYLVGPILGKGLTAIWLVQLCHKSISAIIFTLIWSKGKWQKIKV